MTSVVLRGMLISFALVSSIGMQNLFVVNSAMSNRLRRALLIGVFVWLADTTLTSRCSNCPQRGSHSGPQAHRCHR